MDRRALLVGLASLPLAGGSVSAAPGSARLAALERDSGLHLGVAALNTASGARIAHHADRRFAFCSTVKVILAAAVLKRRALEPALLARRVTVRDADLVAHSPITSGQVGGVMSVGDLCAAALRYSDNAAGNLLIRVLGGPAAATAFAREIGDEVSRLDRLETELNAAVPGDPRDTSTPAAMMDDLRRLALGNGLDEAGRTTLLHWMLGNTTGARRIRAGVPPDWVVADKTGSGDFGTANDIAIAWPPGRPPVLIAIFTTHDTASAPWREDVIAAAAGIVADAFR